MFERCGQLPNTAEHDHRADAQGFRGERDGAVAWRRCDCVVERVVRIE